MTEAEMFEVEKDAEKGQFRQELSRWFESRGIIAELRSHLRHLMITALQSGQVGTKPTDRSSPKAQALNLVVAEYLLRHGCHYTLSVFTSEVPTLANFNPDATLRGGGGRPKGRRNCFQEEEVEEILNALGMPSRPEQLALLKTSYLGKGNDTSLLELFLQTACQLATKLKIHQHLESNAAEGERLLSKEWTSKIVDVLLGEKMSMSQITAVEEAIFRITEAEARKAVEEERRFQLQLLTEREKRIQEQLRKHQDEIFWRLMEAEKDLSARKDTIEEELSRREEHLTKMAIEWNNKHKQILRLAMKFHDLENENKTFKKELKESEEENRSLREREETQTRKMAELEEELNSLSRKLKEVTDSNAILTEQIQVLINGEGEEAPGTERGANQAMTGEPSEMPENTTFHPQYTTLSQKKDTRMTSPLSSEPFNPGENANAFHNFEHPEEKLDSDEDESDSVSSSLGSIIEGVQRKLQVLEEESNRLNQSYLEYRLKCISTDSDSESSKNVSVTSSVKKQEETTVKDTKFCQTSVGNAFAIIQNLKESTKEEKYDLEKFFGNKPETSPTKLVTREPNKRQLHNREFFLKSRQLLRQFETRQRLRVSGTSSSGEETTPSSGSQASPKQVPSVTPQTKAHAKLPFLENDRNCLALLEETRLKSPQESARRPLRQQMLVSESEEDRRDEGRSSRFAMSPLSASSGKMSVGKSTGRSGFW